MPELKFLPNDAGEGEGLSDPGIETYRADPFPAVARETSQNSRDAHDKARCPASPVCVEFERITIPSKTLPGHRRFIEVAERCLDLATAQNRKKEQTFFRQALRVLNQEDIPVLRISDTNTTGLKGPCVEGQPFHSLVKSSGISQKPDDTSSGSFGIGKSAVYSASELQTVFYSTIYVGDNGEATFLCQGKTKFMSFSEPDGSAFRSVGYWGEPSGYQPVASTTSVPEWLRRPAIGTTVCSIAVRDSEDWQHRIMASLLTNFFSAIHKGEIEFKVHGEVLNSRTLGFHFDSQAVRDAAATSIDDFAFAQRMYDCLASTEDTIHHTLTVPGAGTFRFLVTVRDGLPKRVGIIRNGMYVCDTLAHFGDKLARFPLYRDFVALLEPADDSANSWLRRLENPRHDEFSPERLLTRAERDQALAAGKRLVGMIRAKIEELAKPRSHAETDLDELNEFFALDTRGKRDAAGARAVETFAVVERAPRSRSRTTKPPGTTLDGGEGGKAQKHGKGRSGEDGAGPGAGAGAGGSGTYSRRRPFLFRDPRTLIPDPNDLTRRSVLLTPDETGEAVLQFDAAGLNDTQPLQTVPPECRVLCTKDVRQVVEVVFDTPYGGPIEVTSWKLEAPRDEA